MFLVGFVLLDTRSFKCIFCRSLFVLLFIFFWPLCRLFFFDIRILINPLVSSKSAYYNWVDVTASGHFVPEDIILSVAIKCMNLRRSARILVQTSPSIKRSEQDGTMDTASSGTAGVPSCKDATNNLEIQIITLMTKCQTYVCVLVLFSYMIFCILMTLNNIVSFLNVEPKTARPAIF